MLHTIKEYKKDFNLLYLDYGEILIESIRCYSYNQSLKKLYIYLKIELKENFIYVLDRSYLIRIY